MKFDITVGPFIGDPQRTVKLASVAEKNGFNAVWITHDPLWENSWVLAGAIAANTEKIEVGPGIVNPFSSTTVEIAMGSATLQNLSKGRAILGIGPGSKKMLEESGLGHKNVLKTMDESISYLKQALNPSTSPLKIKTVNPIPIFVGCQSPQMLQRIGRWKVGSLVLLTPPRYGEKALNLIKKGCNNQVDEQFLENQVASILCSVAEDESEARKTFAKFIIHILPYLSPTQLQELSIDQSFILYVERLFHEEGWESIPEKIYELGAVGVEDLFKKIEMLNKIGFTRFKIGSPLGPDIDKAVELISSEVLSYFND